MADYLAWYLVELRLRLDGKMPAQRVDTVISEVESHLRESARQHSDTPGVSEERAVVTAIQSFGQPEQVASAHLGGRNPRMFGLPRLWVVLGSALLATGCWNFQWMSLGGFFDNFGATWQNGIAALVGSIALCVLFMACRGGFQSYRKQLTMLSFGTAFGLIFLLSFWIVSDKGLQQGFSRFHLSRDVAMAHQTLGRLEAMGSYMQKGRVLFAEAKDGKDIPLEYRDAAAGAQFMGLMNNISPSYWTVDRGLHEKPKMFIHPSGSVTAMVDGRIFGFQVVDHFQAAKQEWQLNAYRSIKSSEQQRVKMQLLLNSADQARNGRVFFFNTQVFVDPMFWTLVFLPGLLLVDTIAWAFSRRRPSWPKVGIA